jgi:hypothetical protein
MAWFEELNVDELQVPDEVKATLKNAATEAKATNETLTTLNNTVASMQTELTTLKAKPPETLTDAQKAVNLSLEGKRDMILFRFCQDNDKLKDFRLYEQQIRKNLEGSPLELQANEQYILNVYFMIRGMNVDKIVNEVKKGEGAYFSETPSGHTPPAPAAPGSVESLSAGELVYCEKNKTR